MIPDELVASANATATEWTVHLWSWRAYLITRVINNPEYGPAGSIPMTPRMAYRATLPTSVYYEHYLTFCALERMGLLEKGETIGAQSRR